MGKSKRITEYQIFLLTFASGRFPDRNSADILDLRRIWPRHVDEFVGVEKEKRLTLIQFDERRKVAEDRVQFCLLDGADIGDNVVQLPALV